MLFGCVAYVSEGLRKAVRFILMRFLMMSIAEAPWILAAEGKGHFSAFENPVPRAFIEGNYPQIFLN